MLKYLPVGVSVFPVLLWKDRPNDIFYKVGFSRIVIRKTYLHPNKIQSIPTYMTESNIVGADVYNSEMYMFNTVFSYSLNLQCHGFIFRIEDVMI